MIEGDAQDDVADYIWPVVFFVTVLNRLIRLSGNIAKLLCYPFHAIAPAERFSIPAYAPPKGATRIASAVPRVIWQTNYTNRFSLPMYLNYRFNRWLSRGYAHRYVSTEAREVFMREHASPEVYKAYRMLTDGAAQADLWRIVTLYMNGGIYMDIDATLVLPLRIILRGVHKALYIRIKKNTEITNYFLASVPGNPDYKLILERIVQNILSHDGTTRAYTTTGPVVLNQVLADRAIASRPHRYVCMQGAFTNEHFQYIDKPRGKWTYQNPKDLVQRG